MQLSPLHAENNSVSAALLSPLLVASVGNPWFRSCPVTSDDEWMRLGVLRVLEQEPSGRGFVQAMRDGNHSNLAVSSLFDNLSSARRLRACRWSSHALRQKMDKQRSAIDPLAAYPCLNGFAIFAGDGHYHEKATHDFARLGHDTATQHFYALDLRTHSLRHITAAQTGPETDKKGEKTIRKREHDMHAMKRLGPTHMRMETPAGKKVLLVWDRAAIDLPMWAKWKAQHGIYFISRLKDLLVLTKEGNFIFDANDPINAGIESDELVSSGNGSPVRLITYLCPITKVRHQFLTSDNTLPPGIIAYLYKVRWDIEKVFDQVKIKCKELKSWGSSPEAKETQAQFVCIAHNLMILLEDRLAFEHQILNQRELNRKQNRINLQCAIARKSKLIIAPMYHAIVRMSQRCVPFIRWLRNHIRARGLWNQSLPSLRRIYGVSIL
jgi:hypothetical protein